MSELIARIDPVIAMYTCIGIAGFIAYKYADTHYVPDKEQKKSL